ncbi:uncharacterized protein EHS24_005216 [Apiotrichum porosum]|uniref:Uncharacterized protein n=1 Tax=Apiotrichum porosum TaxID=105984 RepID=A0A427XDK8_9TREE|nr:uncharacterized protein EHS24_005216 [Apiotrichum porosum]RSH76817.1 hypothetical protein EHS24_005216 [Apiotrichum porosum]
MRPDPVENAAPNAGWSRGCWGVGVGDGWLRAKLSRRRLLLIQQLAKWCPKVEKQEKKKTPKGRAKKRAQYTRRFVNVTLTPGGKRSMNQQPAGKSG